MSTIESDKGDTLSGCTADIKASNRACLNLKAGTFWPKYWSLARDIA